MPTVHVQHQDVPSHHCTQGREEHSFRRVCYCALQLFEWGLRPETAVGCALNYLFRPREEVLDLVRDSYKALRDTAALKIGIQVRCLGAGLHCPGVGWSPCDAITQRLCIVSCRHWSGSNQSCPTLFACLHTVSVLILFLQAAKHCSRCAWGTTGSCPSRLSRGGSATPRSTRRTAHAWTGGSSARSRWGAPVCGRQCNALVGGP